MKKALILSSAILAFSATAQETFTYELGAAHIDAEGGKAYIAAGSYYFSEVDTSQGPLAEAVFLDRSNTLDFAFTRVEADGVSGGVNAVAVGGTYQFADNGLFITANAVQVNGSDDGSFGLGLGYYISGDWTVSVDTAFDEDVEYTGLALSTKKLLTLGGDRFLNLEATINVPDEGDDSYAVAADYYFNRKVSVGLDYIWADSFSDGGTVANVNWFFTPTTALFVEYSDDSVSDAISIGINSRF